MGMRWGCEIFGLTCEEMNDRSMNVARNMSSLPLEDDCDGEVVELNFTTMPLAVLRVSNSSF